MLTVMFEEGTTRPAPGTSGRPGKRRFPGRPDVVAGSVAKKAKWLVPIQFPDCTSGKPRRTNSAFYSSNGMPWQS